MMRRDHPNLLQRQRCAIYTRKSSEEGLEQEFNSLHAQREACEAYIRSQIHAGWRTLNTAYDDGGISGGTLARPALQRLLADAAAGRIDIVVVYKVDRLTRSLADFARIVDIFDTHGISFVSVTQAFNTTTSMGRLTLNVLLSFAQFEREVTGERIRDKIAASKKKGLWMGGLSPLGYDVHERKLVVNATEAETVRHLFKRYLALGSVRALRDELDASDVVSKQRTDRTGRITGGQRFSRGGLYLILQNRTYLGEIVHKGTSYSGEHAAIIDRELWNAVEARLQASRSDRSADTGVQEPSPLKGLLFDAEGTRMMPSHAVKGGKRYRYYVSQGLIEGRRTSNPLGQRIPAGDIESLVCDRLAAFLGSELEVTDAVAPFEPDVAALQQILARGRERAAGLQANPSHTHRDLLRSVVHRLVLESKQIRVELDRARLFNNLSSRSDASEQDINDDVPLTIVIPTELKRAGKAMRLIVGDAIANKPDANLIKLVVKAFETRDQLLSDQPESIEALARRTRASGSYMTALVRLTYLAPDIIEAILLGQHPVTLSARRLVTTTKDLPLDWFAQRQWLGFPTG